MLKAFYSLSFESVHRASIGLRIVRALHGHRPIALPSQFASPPHIFLSCLLSLVGGGPKKSRRRSKLVGAGNDSTITSFYLELIRNSFSCIMDRAKAYYFSV